MNNHIEDTSLINLNTGATLPTKTVDNRTVVYGKEIYIGPSFVFEQNKDYDITFDFYCGIANGYIVFGFHDIDNDLRSGGYGNEGASYSSNTMKTEWTENGTYQYQSYETRYKFPVNAWTPVLMKIREGNVYLSYQGRSAYFDNWCGYLLPNAKLEYYYWNNGNHGMTNITITEYPTE